MYAADSPRPHAPKCEQSITRHGIALFPGSFKPPHAAHLHGVRHLLDNTDVAEVIIIISNRCRLIPGSDYAIGAEAARQLFWALLRSAALPLGRIRIEIAKHRATSHALGYFDKVCKTQSLVFCLGSADFAARDDRFAEVQARSKVTGITARIEVLPRAAMDVHASELRRFISEGHAGRTDFLSALPSTIPARQKSMIWENCRRVIQPIGEIVKPKIAVALADRYEISENSLQEITSQSVDPVFQFHHSTGQEFTVKYAGDTTADGAFDENKVQKPAQRLAVERRALKHLATCGDLAFMRPRVDFFDKHNRISVLTRPSASATYIATELDAGIFDENTAIAAARLLAQLHGCPLPKHRFWGDDRADQDHWQCLINSLSARSRRKLQELQRSDLTRQVMSQCSPASRFLHLNFVPENLWRQGDKMGIENFERAGCYGDPAYDVATFVAEYINAGMLHDATAACIEAVGAFINTYLLDQSLSSAGKVHSLTNYLACRLLAVSMPKGNHQFARRRYSLAVALLEKSTSNPGMKQPANVAEILRELLAA